jgi:hypothetical protein
VADDAGLDRWRRNGEGGMMVRAGAGFVGSTLATRSAWAWDATLLLATGSKAYHMRAPAPKTTCTLRFK